MTNFYLQLFKRFSSNHLKLLTILLGLAVLGGVLGWGLWAGKKSDFSISSVTSSLLDYGAEDTGCQSCHRPEANEKLLNEGLFDRGFEIGAQGGYSVSGYASASSVPQGGSIDFYFRTDVITYDIQIYRAGANGLELMMSVTDLPGAYYDCGPYGVPANMEDVDLGCDWPVAYTLNVPTTWPSGLYLVETLAEGEFPKRWGRFIQFIVTENEPGSTADIVFLYPTNTTQAYNEYGGWSFYSEPRGVRITLNRPNVGCNPNLGCQFSWEYPLARWLESEGYQLEYVASEDIHADPTLLFNYTLFIIAGHDEYWTKEFRDNLDAFIDAGGNVAIFSGNTGYRQVRYQDGGRTLVCYKWEDRQSDPLYGVDNIRVASEFESDPINWPENSTTGVRFSNAGYVGGDGQVGKYTVYRSGHWVYAGTGLRDGDEFGYEFVMRVEVDGALFTWENGLPVVTGEDETPLDFTILGLQSATHGTATMGIYNRDGGGTVFNAATMGWPRGLWPENNPEDYEIVRQITQNVVDTLSSGETPPPPTYPVQETLFTYQPGNVLESEVMTFTAFITPSYASPPIIYTWQFGDGTSAASTSSNVKNHTYETAGTYTVSITAANTYGQSALNRTIVVMDPNTPKNENRAFLPLILKNN